MSSSNHTIHFLFLFMMVSVTAISFFDTDIAYAQNIVDTIVVEETVPCFLNYTASYRILQNCNANGDFLEWILLGWEYITGGNFTLIFVSVLIIAVYMKYQTVIYPIFIGTIFMPVSFFVFPDIFLIWSITMMFIGIGILIWFALLRQTRA